MKKTVLLLFLLLSAVVVSAQKDIVFPYDLSIPVIENCKVLNYTDMGFVTYKKDGLNSQIVAIKAIQNGFQRTFPKVELTVMNNLSLYGPKIKPLIKLPDTLITKRDSTFYSFLSDELSYENEMYLQIKRHLNSVRTTKVIGIVVTSGGLLLTTIGLANDYQNMYIGGGIASVVGILVWISAPTKPLSYQLQMTIKRIKHLENLRSKYDVSINIFQPRDMAGIGISLNF